MRSLCNGLPVPPTATPIIRRRASKLGECHSCPKSFPIPLSLKNPLFPFPHNKKDTLCSRIPEASMSSGSREADAKPISVLFVCLGNICRSPAAEGVFRHLVSQRGLGPTFHIDSAGTINYHEGNQADPRMRAAAQARGMPITSVSRPIRPSDFQDFDIILAMDKQNKEDILSALERWSSKKALPSDAANKIKLMCSYCKTHKETEVPDPYYGGQQGFEKVLDILEDSCQSLLDSILAENSNLVGSQ